MPSENVDAVRSMFEAFRRGDLPAAFAVVHPDVEVRPSLVGGLEGNVYRGLDGYRQFLDDVDSVWVDFQVEIREIRDLGDTVVVLGHTWGRGREGIAVDDPGGWVFGMRDGKVHRFRSFNTWQETLDAAGLTENVELVRGLYAQLASEGSTHEFEQRLTDDALSRFLDPGIEWVPVSHSLLAVESYRGFDGVRRFWGEFLSAWETYGVELLSVHEAGDQVAVVVHIVGRTKELEIDETHSSLLTVRDGRVVRVQAFDDPDAAREAVGLPP
jgi:ketosteroid isomerase-like protein